MVQEEQQNVQPIQQNDERAGGHSAQQGGQHEHSNKLHFQKPREQKQFVKRPGNNEGKERGEGRESSRSNTIFIGKKPPSVYALAVVSLFNEGQKQVLVKARGNAIVPAVNISQMVKHKFIPTLQIGRIEISTEELTSEDGKMHRVSSMLIPLTKE